MAFAGQNLMLILGALVNQDHTANGIIEAVRYLGGYAGRHQVEGAGQQNDMSPAFVQVVNQLSHIGIGRWPIKKWILM